MFDDYEIIEFEKPSLFREWLESNVEKQEGVWVRFYKKASGIPSLTHAEALDEALCFGWIDSAAKKYDERSYIHKFTPRRKQSLWSKRNREHIERLRREGMMTAAGEAEVRRAIEDGRWDAAYDAPSTMTVPDDFIKKLENHPNAKAFFETLNKTSCYAIAWRLQTAKTDATRIRREEKLIEMLNNEIRP